MPLESSVPDDAAEIEVSVVMPCLNESRTVGICTAKAIACLTALGVKHEVVIADNGSTDDSTAIAERAGARVAHITNKGYGSALRGGIEASRGKFIIMGDSDDSYDFTNLKPFIDKLREGYDLVVGNRFMGGIKPGAMPPLHRYLGNPVLSFIGRLFFKTGIRDFHCGLRGFSKDAITRMELQTTGMEFASEIVVKACLLEMRVIEVPTTLSPDGRDRAPHLRSWRDGWRHLRFLLMFSPRWLFLYPGLLLIAVGLVASVVITAAPIVFGTVTLDIHTLSFTAAMILIGFNAVSFAFLARIYALQAGLIPRKSMSLRLFEHVTLEMGLIVGAILAFAGLAGFASVFAYWAHLNFGPLDTMFTMRIIIPSSMGLILGAQTIFTSFLLSILGLSKK